MTKVLELKIAVVVTVQNFKLFKKTKNSIPPGIDLFVVDGRYGFYALNALELVFSSDQIAKYDWIIMADEDVIFIDFDAILELIHRMKNNDHQLAGVSDGSALEFRKGDPTIPNLFFCVFNNFKIRSIFKGEQQFLEYHKFKLYQSVKKRKYKTSRINKMTEEYYQFFNFLKINGIRIFFLNAIHDTFPQDYYTTKVLDNQNNLLIIHTWFARDYGRNMDQKQRIDRVLFNHAFEIKNRKYLKLNNPMHFKFKLKYRLKMLKKKIKRVILMK